MFSRYRTYFILLTLTLSVLWHGCKDPLPIVFTADVINIIGPLTDISTPLKDPVALTTVDSSGWEIISNDTSYNAIALLSTIQYDSATTHHQVVLSKVLVQDRSQPVYNSSQTQLVGYKGLQLSQIEGDDVPMHIEKRRVPIGLGDTALGYQYSAVNIDNEGPDNSLHYREGEIFNWTVQLQNANPVNIGGIPPGLIRLIQPSPDSVEILDVNKECTIQWLGSNESVDLVISDYYNGSVKPLKHINFQHIQSNTAKIDIHEIPVGQCLFTFSTTTEVTSNINGIPILLRFASIHNVVVRMK
ncbi:MAG: hypothetical protein ABSB78_07530 [Bacteroidota bacterium]